MPENAFHRHENIETVDVKPDPVSPGPSDMDRLLLYFEDKWTRFEQANFRLHGLPPRDYIRNAYWSEVARMIAGAYDETTILNTVDMCKSSEKWTELLKPWAP